MGVGLATSILTLGEKIVREMSQLMITSVVHSQKLPRGVYDDNEYSIDSQA